MIAALFAGAVYVPALQSQSSAEPAFEVAAIKPAPPLTPSTLGQARFQVDDAIVDYSSVPLMTLISMAYETPADYISGPGWLESQNFSLRAKLPAGSSKSQVPAMLRRLLAERFKLETHPGERIEPAYLMSVGKEGVKFKQSSDAQPDAGRCDGRPGVTICRSTTMAALARQLTQRFKQRAQFSAAGLPPDDSQRDIDRPVLDQTGLTAAFDFELDWDAPSRGGRGRGGTLVPSNSPAPAADIFKALEAAGLKLEPARHTFKTVVIDHIEKVPIEN